MRYLLILLFIMIGAFGSIVFADSEGRSIQTLIQRYGQPILVNHLRNGNTVYVFSVPRPKTFTLPRATPATVLVTPKGQAIGVPTPAYSTPQYTGVRCTLTFLVNARGIIVQSQAEGSGCQ